MSALKETIAILANDRVRAHRFLFQARHSEDPALFHDEMIRDFHNPTITRYCAIGFRGCAKSTITEEGVVLKAALREFQNCIVFGASEKLAIRRVHSIKRQFENNERLKKVFGDLKGQPWSDDHIELSTGITITAKGRGQALRGEKGEELRPDLLVFDDIEDREAVRTPDLREKTQAWFFSDAMPMMDKNGIVRMMSNDLDPECLANILARHGSGFLVKRYPWLYLDDKGEMQPAWPSRFPMEAIEQMRRSMIAVGRLDDYLKEYMCQSRAPEAKTFKGDMIKVQPTVRTYQAVYGFIDPARTVRQTSADTGFAAWSYIGPRIVVWDAWGRKLLPSEIVDSIFTFNDEFRPALIGVERDGLEEFLMQPIRQEQLKRSTLVPVQGVKAPKGKLDFIRGLQPFFIAGEMVFAKDLGDLKAQLLAFPSGLIDIPNALAYALKMRPGAPMYEDFSLANVEESLSGVMGRPFWLCLNAEAGIVTGCLIQYFDRTLRVLADWAREGDAQMAATDILREASMEAGRTIKVVLLPKHYDRFANVGLKQACIRAQADVRKGVEPERGRSEIREMMGKQVRGFASVKVNPQAIWTANAFSGAYARGVGPRGEISDVANPGPYRTMMEGVEACVGLMQLGSTEDETIHYDYTAEGRQFISARRQ